MRAVRLADRSLELTKSKDVVAINLTTVLE